MIARFSSMMVGRCSCQTARRSGRSSCSSRWGQATTVAFVDLDVQAPTRRRSARSPTRGSSRRAGRSSPGIASPGAGTRSGTSANVEAAPSVARSVAPRRGSSGGAAPHLERAAIQCRCPSDRIAWFQFATVPRPRSTPKGFRDARSGSGGKPPSRGRSAPLSRSAVACGLRREEPPSGPVLISA